MHLIVDLLLVVAFLAVLALPLLGAIGASEVLAELSRHKPPGHWLRSPWLPIPTLVVGFLLGRAIGMEALNTATSLSAALAGGA